MNKTIINKIISYARLVCPECQDKELYRDFRVMESSLIPEGLFLRFTHINISNPEKPSQCYHYLCFDLNGNPLDCSVFYSDAKEANAFFQSLFTTYHQPYLKSIISNHKSK